MSFNATDPTNHKGKTDTWLTPLWLIQDLGGDFDFDPCPFVPHPTAKKLCIGDGLKEKWFGKVWLNPPYSEAKKWLDKMVQHRNGTCLIFSRTGTLGWYIKDCDHLFFLRNRVRFLDKNFKLARFNPGADSMLLMWGEQDFSKLKGVQIK